MNTYVSSSSRFSTSFNAKLLLLSDILTFFALCAVALCLGPRNGLWVSGLVIGGAGFAAWTVARRQLGDSFMIGAQAKQLVTHGLYRRFRHPIYLFSGLAHFGALLALQNFWLMLIWFAYATPIQWARLRREDHVLEAKFGEAFVQLRSQAWI